MFRIVIVLVVLLASVSAFTSKFSTKSSLALNAKSKSVPFLEQPPALDGKLAGDVGFDPFNLSGYWADVSVAIFYVV